MEETSSLRPHDIRHRDGIILSKGIMPIEAHEAVLKDVDNKNNLYATSKSVSQISLNTTTIQSQIYIFALLLSSPIVNGFQITLLIFIPLSLIVQFTIYILLIILAKTSSEQATKSYTATSINSFVTALSGGLVIITSFITIFSWKAGVGSIGSIGNPNINSSVI